MTKEALFEQFNISSKKYCIGLFPGTREQEIKHLTPIFMETIKLLNKEHDQYQFFCPLTDKKSINKVQSLLDKNNLHNVQIYEGNSSDIIQAADASIAKNGTVTLEHSIIGTPFICCYKFAKLSYWLIYFFHGRHYFKKCPYLCLPNILANKEIIPELIQKKCTPIQLKNSLQKMLKKNTYERVKKDFDDLKNNIIRQRPTFHVVQHIIRSLNL